MKAEVTRDAALFREWVFPFLQRDPVLNSVLLTNIWMRAERLVAETEPSMFVCMRDDSGEVGAAAMRSPGRWAMIGSPRDDHVAALVDAFAEHDPGLPGVFGVERAVGLFLDRWPAEIAETRGSRLHHLGDLVPHDAPGGPRLADDIELSARWGAAFHEEIEEAGGDQAAWAAERIAAESLWLWEDEGVPVSLLGHQVPAFGVTRIGPVYTPPEFRGRGYASALTAHVSGLIRERGQEVCLFTDLANPTSNKIYAAIGYRPVADFAGHRFKGA